MPRRNHTTPRKRRPRPVASAAPAARLAADANAHSEFELTNGHIETALLTGEDAGLLEDYFGPEEYAQLRQLSREAAARAVRGGPKVLILPGIMGSKIGKRGRLNIFDDVYWFDPVDICAGRLVELALDGAPSRFEALGVMLSAYLKLKLRLRIAGYDPEFCAFDWRRSIADLGKALMAQLKKHGGDTVNIVAHSMGGLVARWALGSGGQCRRLIMLGTPNYGSFAPVMALRGTYPVVRKVAALDVKHSAEELARDVFSTFPGLTEMLPSPERYRELDLYDLSSWPHPDDGLRPRAAILAGVQAVQRKLASGDARFFLIAGIDQSTVTGLQRDDAGGFIYEYSHAGDGTVPVDFARLPDVPTYYVSEAHGSLANNKIVASAVLDLLDRGETAVLPRTYAAEERRLDVQRCGEHELRTDPYTGRRGGLLSRRELRTLMEEVAAPHARDEIPAPALVEPRAGTAGSDAAEPGYRHAFDRIVVGRLRQHRVDLRFAFGSITEADARALAVGIFRDVAPSGAATALDRRLGGAITEISRRRMFSGNVGEIFILPTGRHLIAADLIAFVGLGAFDRFTDEVLQIAAENVIRTFVNSQVEEFSTVLLGAGSGERPEAALRNMLAGFIRGLCDADKDHHFRRLVVCERDQERYTLLKEELYRLSSTSLCRDVEFTFDEVTLKPALEVGPIPTRLREREDPVYLILRQERRIDGDSDVRSSVLTAGAKATVVTGVRTVREPEFERVRARLVDPRVLDVAPDGNHLARMLLAEEVRIVLPRYRDRHLVVVHDAALSRVPWETIAFTDEAGRSPTWMPAADKGLSHRYAADNLSVAKWLEDRLEDEILTVLLVVNPTEDLDGAEAEGARIQQMVTECQGCRLEILRRGAATRPALLSAFGSGRYDIIHYAGHAFFDESRPERSGIVCHGGVTLSGVDVAGLGNLPTLVFFNACEAGRLRRGDAGQMRSPARSTRKRVDKMAESVGFAEAFMRGGVANVLGTYWPVGDLAAKVFAEAFYAGVMKGARLGAAIQDGRNAVRQTPSKDWVDYVFYGNPDFVLKEAARRRAEASQEG